MSTAQVSVMLPQAHMSPQGFQSIMLLFEIDWSHTTLQHRSKNSRTDSSPRLLRHGVSTCWERATNFVMSIVHVTQVSWWEMRPRGSVPVQSTTHVRTQQPAQANWFSRPAGNANNRSTPDLSPTCVRTQQPGAAMLIDSHGRPVKVPKRAVVACCWLR